MFTTLAQPWQRIWLIGLLVLWAVLLFGGFFLGEGERRMPAWSRMASSATLVVAAFSWYAFSRTTPAWQLCPPHRPSRMTFGFIGDLALAGWLPGGRNTIGGIASFGIGHVFYIAAFLRYGSARWGWMTRARWIALAFWLLIGLVGWYFVVYRGAATTGEGVTVIHWIALTYALLLATTAGLATGLALADSGFIPLALGAALFLLSDLILAGEMFSGLSFPLIDDAIWLTYGPAQMLIVYSIAIVLARLRG